MWLPPSGGPQLLAVERNLRRLRPEFGMIRSRSDRQPAVLFFGSWFRLWLDHGEACLLEKSVAQRPAARSRPGRRAAAHCSRAEPSQATPRIRNDSVAQQSAAAVLFFGSWFRLWLGHGEACLLAKSVAQRPAARSRPRAEARSSSTSLACSAGRTQIRNDSVARQSAAAVLFFGSWSRL